jgi:hypothetical protein
MITTKLTDTIGEKKEGNILELSLLGIYNTHQRTELKLVAEEISQNPFQTYLYEISTYLLESYQGFSNVTNLIEYHHNLNQNYKTNEFKIDNSVFYNGVSYLEKLDEYLTISKYFVKYITNSYIGFPLGSCSIVEMARCEENMEIILSSLGYREKSRIIKKGDFIKFRNYPIVIFLTSAEKVNIEENNTVHSVHTVNNPVSSEKNVGSTSQTQTPNGNIQTTPTKNLPSNQPKPPTVNYIIEIIGFCYENEKENLSKILSLIKEKLVPYCIFESDVQAGAVQS